MGGRVPIISSSESDGQETSFLSIPAKVCYPLPMGRTNWCDQDKEDDV